MKRVSLILLAIAISSTVNAQYWTGSTTVKTTTTSSVGIGTLTPSAFLHVAGTMRLAPNVTATDYVLTSIDANGNAQWKAPTWTKTATTLSSTLSVGVGIAAPTAKLHVAGTVRLVPNTSAIDFVLTSIDANGNAQWKAPTWTKTATTLSSTLSVGVGIAAPTAKLHVAGTMRLVPNTSATDYVLTSIDANGNAQWKAPTWTKTATTLSSTLSIGIGVTSPDAKLHVKDGFIHIETGVTGVAGPSINFGTGNTDDAQLGQYGIEYISGSGLNFWTPNGSELGMQNDILFLHKSGCVGIGTNLASNTNNYYKLSVNGSVRAKEVVVEAGWADYVFADDYKLKSLDEVELYIKEHKTLPNIPSEQEIKKQNIGLGEQNRLQQEKIEELTLYAIQQQKQIDILLERLSKVETLIGR